MDHAERTAADTQRSSPNRCRTQYATQDIEAGSSSDRLTSRNNRLDISQQRTGDGTACSSHEAYSAASHHSILPTRARFA